jgi:hypothetical protein
VSDLVIRPRSEQIEPSLEQEPIVALPRESGVLSVPVASTVLYDVTGARRLAVGRRWDPPGFLTGVRAMKKPFAAHGRARRPKVCSLAHVQAPRAFTVRCAVVSLRQRCRPHERGNPEVLADTRNATDVRRVCGTSVRREPLVERQLQRRRQVPAEHPAGIEIASGEQDLQRPLFADEQHPFVSLARRVC